MGVHNFFFHQNIKIELTWLLREEAKFMRRRIVSISANFHIDDTTFNNFVQQYLTVIVWALITLEEQFILFEKIVSFDGISWKEDLAPRRKNIIWRAVRSILVEKLNLKINIFVWAWIWCNLFDFGQLRDKHRPYSEYIASWSFHNSLSNFFIFFVKFELHWSIHVPIVKFTSGWGQVVISNGSRYRSNVLNVSVVLALSGFLYILFVVWNFTAEEELLVTVYYESCICNAYGFSDLANPNVIEFFECFSM